MISFESLMERLRAWREKDHADNIILNRNEIILLIDGVKDLDEEIESLNQEIRETADE